MSAIRLAYPQDCEQIAAIYAPYCQTPISFELAAPSSDEMCARMAKVMPMLPWLVLEEGDEILGYAYASPHHERAAYRWSVNTSVYVARSAIRSGVGRRLYESLFELLKAQRFINAYAGITLPNAGSVGLHESFGFKPVGVYRQVGFKCDSWHDVGWWHLVLQDSEMPPAEPLSVFEAMHTL